MCRKIRAQRGRCGDPPEHSVVVLVVTLCLCLCSGSGGGTMCLRLVGMDLVWGSKYRQGPRTETVARSREQ